MNRTVLHIDINSYFATLLQQENPHLRGKPIGVVKEARRVCIIAASKEAKKMGLKTGMGAFEARHLIPNLQLVPANFTMYLHATKTLKEIFEAISPEIEIYSLDEAFVDLTNCQQFMYRNPYDVGKQAQQMIKNRLGSWVTCNVGIGPNRFLAKLSSEISPKGSISEITPENLDGILATTEFASVCGVGMRLEKKLKLIGVTNLYQLRFYTEEELCAYVGKFWAKELLKMAYGEEPHHLELLDREQPHMKSVGRSITGYRLCDNETEIKRVLFNLCDEVTYKVRKMNLAGRYVGIGLHGEDLSWYTHKTLKYYIRHTNEMFNLIYGQLYKPWKRNFAIIKFGVVLGHLQPMNQITQSLLPNWEKQERLYKALDTISNKYGLFTAYSALLMRGKIIRPEVTGFLGDKKYQLEH